MTIIIEVQITFLQKKTIENSFRGPEFVCQFSKSCHIGTDHTHLEICESCAFKENA